MTFEETARNYDWLAEELEHIAKHPDPAVRLDRLAGLFHFYLTDVIENEQLASLVGKAIGSLPQPAE
jgi:4-alpha-glucanotransferase